LLPLAAKLSGIFSVSEFCKKFFHTILFFKLKIKGGFMIARLTYFGLNQKDVEDLKRIYNEETMPVIKKQKGFLGAWLLEPTDPKDQYISLTEWVSQADADAYEASGTYKQLVGKVKDRFIGDPVLKIYTAAETKIMTPA